MSSNGDKARFDAYHKLLGIPPDEQPPNHYRLLAIPAFESDAEVIRNGFDQRMMHLKTFGTGPHAAASQRLLNEVATAKVCLLSPARKLAYDEALRATNGKMPNVTEVLEGLWVSPAQPIEGLSDFTAMCPTCWRLVKYNLTLSQQVIACTQCQGHFRVPGRNQIRPQKSKQATAPTQLERPVVQTSIYESVRSPGKGNEKVEQLGKRRFLINTLIWQWVVSLIIAGLVFALLWLVAGRQIPEASSRLVAPPERDAGKGDPSLRRSDAGANVGDSKQLVPTGPDAPNTGKESTKAPRDPQETTSTKATITENQRGGPAREGRPQEDASAQSGHTSDEDAQRGLNNGEVISESVPTRLSAITLDLTHPFTRYPLKLPGADQADKREFYLVVTQLIGPNVDGRPLTQNSARLDSPLIFTLPKVAAKAPKLRVKLHRDNDEFALFVSGDVTVSRTKFSLSKTGSDSPTERKKALIETAGRASDALPVRQRELKQLTAEFANVSRLRADNAGQLGVKKARLAVLDRLIQSKIGKIKGLQSDIIQANRLVPVAEAIEKLVASIHGSAQLHFRVTSLVDGSEQVLLQVGDELQRDGTPMRN